MHAYRIVWEDEAKAREVEIYVSYTFADTVVTVNDIRPTKVTLYSSETRQPVRTLPVHTAGGRQLLAQAYLASRETEPTLADEILVAHELRDGLAAAIA